MPLKREPNVRFTKDELADFNSRQPNQLRAEERSTLLVLANQYLSLQKWIQHTVPEWTQEVQCCMDDCERTANHIIDYLDGKTEHLNPVLQRKSESQRNK